MNGLPGLVLRVRRFFRGGGWSVVWETSLSAASCSSPAILPSIVGLAATRRRDTRGARTGQNTTYTAGSSVVSADDVDDADDAGDAGDAGMAGESCKTHFLCCGKAGSSVVSTDDADVADVAGNVTNAGAGCKTDFLCCCGKTGPGVRSKSDL